MLFLRTDQMKIRPITLAKANELVKALHRHHKPVQGHRFSLSLWDNDRLVGVAVVGRPVSRELDPEKIAEVTRLYTDGTKNACSMLYSACARTCREMGFEKIQTYILQSERGDSLRAAGWEFEVITRGGTWNCGVRKNRREDQPMEQKQRWAKKLV